MSHSITVTVNGTPMEFAPGTSLGAVVASLGHDPDRPGVAAAIDGQVVRQTNWTETVVAAGQQVEVLTAVQGGSS